MLNTILDFFRPSSRKANLAQDTSRSAATSASPPVVLLHGLWNTPLSMRRMARGLQARGFTTINLGYPSSRYPPEQLAEFIWSRIHQRIGSDEHPLDFVAHSLGGLLVRQLAQQRPINIRRLVMLSPPNQGSEWVAWIHRIPLLPRVVGPAGCALGTGQEDYPARLPAPDYPVGVIAGSKPDNPFSRWLIPGPDDGRVSVSCTRLSGMADHITVHHGHVQIPSRPDVIEQTAYFLRHGTFRWT